MSAINRRPTYIYGKISRSLLQRAQADMLIRLLFFIILSVSLSFPLIYGCFVSLSLFVCYSRARIHAYVLWDVFALCCVPLLLRRLKIYLFIFRVPHSALKYANVYVNVCVRGSALVYFRLFVHFPHISHSFRYAHKLICQASRT